jgi:hypothetical protein
MDGRSEIAGENPGPDPNRVRWLLHRRDVAAAVAPSEFGPILANFYPAPDGQPQFIYENFHRTLPFNPCPTFAEDE